MFSVVFYTPAAEKVFGSDAWLALATYCRVITVNLRWVGPHDERAWFIFHDTIARLVD